MPESKVDLTKVKTWMVNFDHPWCYKHSRAHRIHTTRRKNKGTVVEVVRYHHCEQCIAEGGDEPPPLFNSRDFKNSPMAQQ